MGLTVLLYARYPQPMAFRQYIDCMTFLMLLTANYKVKTEVERRSTV